MNFHVIWSLFISYLLVYFYLFKVLLLIYYRKKQLKISIEKEDAKKIYTSAWIFIHADVYIIPKAIHGGKESDMSKAMRG